MTIFQRPTTRRDVLQRSALAAVSVAAPAVAARSALANPAHAPAGHAASHQVPANVITIATNRAPSDLDPHSAYDAGSGVPIQGPFEPLIRLKGGSADEFVPLLAETWTANADKSIWTFTLRPNLTFHDGSPCDAEAVRASFERLLTLGYTASSVLGRFIQDPSQITAPDALTVVFDLGRPQPLFEVAIAAPFGTAIVNATLAKSHEVDGDWGHGWAQSETAGLGTGPYRITQFDPGEVIELERFAGYWRGWGERHADAAVIRIVAEETTRRELIERGEIDIAENLSPNMIRAVEANPDVVVIKQFNLATNYVAMAMSGPLASVAARQALCWAFPYDDVIEGVFDGLAKRAIGPVAELCRGFHPETFVYHTDIDRARSLLAEAGVAAGTTLTMMLVNGNVRLQTIFELFAASLASLEIEVRPESVDFAGYLSIAFGDQPDEERPHLYPSFWQPDYNDAWSHLWPQLSCDNWQGGNLGRYCNPRVEELLLQARDSADDATYQTALAEIQQTVTRDDPAAIYFAQPQWTTAVRKELGGLILNPVASEIHDFYALYRAE